MAAKISVIVPVYNTEKYVEECIESVLAQTYTDFELILIDDGSEDRSREICRRMEKKDTRIHLIQREHKGVSAARNAGMDAAVGKYLFFLDSDDMIHPQLLEALYEVQEKEGTVVAAEGWYQAEDGSLSAEQWEMRSDDTWESIHLDNENAIESFLHRDGELVLYGIGGKMILREAIESLKFDEELTHGEDTLFLYQVLVSGADITILFLKWYYYRLHEMCAIKKYSITACRSRYKVECYIREQEMKNGRMSNVIYQEWVILSNLIEWHEFGRNKQDNELRRNVKKWYYSEKGLKFFEDLRWWNKLEIFVGFYCYGLYKFIHCAAGNMKH